MTGLVTHTDYARPYRPWPVALFNRLGGPGAPRRFDAGALISAARRTTGLTELSDAPLLEPLTRYCEALNTEARLSPFGRIVQRERLKGLLINRLRMDDLMRRRPDLLDQPDPDCLIIAGLARTGTTFLQRILAADPYARSLPAWEALNPAPFPGEVSGRPDARRRKGRQASGFVRWLAPDFRAVHPVEPGAPEEDILLLDLTLMSQTAEAVTHVPSYSKWLEAQDHQPTYRYLRDVLKILNGLQPGTHWILKTPNHAEHLDCILDVFPKATVLVTHRDPLATMPSCCSLMAHAQALSSDDIDPHAIGTHWLRKSVLMARRTVEARARHIRAARRSTLCMRTCSAILRRLSTRFTPYTDLHLLLRAQLPSKPQRQTPDAPLIATSDTPIASMISVCRRT